MHPPRVFRIEFGPLDVNISVTVKVESDAEKIKDLTGKLDTSNEELRDAVESTQANPS